MSDSPLTWRGTVVAVCLTPRGGEPLRAVPYLELVIGKGIVGDRYGEGTGTYSNKPEEGRQITLFEEETLEALRRDHDIELSPAEHRRNVTTRGVALNHLVGRRFRVGAVVLEGTRLCTPCTHVEALAGKPICKPLANRGGLNARIIVGGTIRPGDVAEPA